MSGLRKFITNVGIFCMRPKFKIGGGFIIPYDVIFLKASIQAKYYFFTNWGHKQLIMKIVKVGMYARTVRA